VFGERVEVAEQTVSRWFQKGDGRKNIGEKVARRIESKLCLPRGWLDGITQPAAAEQPAPYNAKPMPLRTVLSLLAFHLDTASPVNRPLMADALARFASDPALREGAITTLLALVPPPAQDHRVANAYGDPKVKPPHG
jgi:hypothetical protein